MTPKVLLLLVLTKVLQSSARDWWQNANIYEILPRSFKDTNGDGIGDLNGITESVNYLKEIGVDVVWLTPIYKSPMVDFGYDISDYRAIQREYGTMDDFKRLVSTLKRFGIHLVLDFVPNHTSVEHEWFRKSVRREAGYENFYIWHPGRVNNRTGAREPPNNWLSIFRYSAWEWNDVRKEYYLHQFVKEQPDLNFREPKVRKEMNDILLFWLSMGVSGFRIDIISSIYEVEADKNGNLPDEPKGDECDDPTKHCSLNHTYTTNLQENYDIAYEWHALLVDYQRKHSGESRILLTEAWTTLEKTQLYYGDGVRNGSQVPFNFIFLTDITASKANASIYAKLVDDWLKSMPKDAQANWVLGSHDRSRVASRLGEKRVDLYNILLKTLPGISVNYYVIRNRKVLFKYFELNWILQGEEIGMTDTLISWKDTIDPQACNEDEKVYYKQSRDFARTPFQWDDSRNAGFTRGLRTWIPVNANYYWTNVKIQKRNSRSHLNVYKKLVALRKNPAFYEGTYDGTVLQHDVFAYKR